ncbi:A-kinase anchor protein 10, mitochondrial-like, partial [Glandiceps talaboti]
MTDKKQSEKDAKTKKRHPSGNSTASNSSSPAHKSSPTGSQSSLPNGTPGKSVATSSGARPKTPLLRVGSKQETAVGDLGTGYSSPSKSSLSKSKSRLSKPLAEVLYDNHGALPYLIQYMSYQGYPQLVQFWLAAESFGSVTWTKIKTESLNTVSKSTIGGANSAEVGTHSNKSSNNSTTQQHVTDSAKQQDGGQSRDTSKSGTVAPTLSQSGETSDCKVGCTGSGSTHSNDSNHNEKGDDRDLHSDELLDEETAIQVLNKAMESDAVNIFTRYLGQDAPFPIGISDELRLEIIRKICREDGQVDPNCFVPAQKFVYDVLEKHYFDSFIESEFHCKYQVDILTSGTVYLCDVIYNEISMIYFMEYIEQEQANDLLQFWLAGDNFQRQLLEQRGQYDPIEAQNDAMVLYDRYFSLQATHPVGFSDAVRFEVECNICREEGPLPDCFATSMRIAHNTLEKVYLQGFLTSELYFKYLNELINTIKNDPGTIVPSPHTRRKRRNSDSSSEHSVGSQKENKNTLLAKGTKKSQILDKVAGDMRIDTGNFDPDILWQRPKTGGMSFGKVNELGQFIAECEPDPDITKGKTSKLDKVKKWVTGGEDKTQEQMAWQVAQMIINDVSKQ